MAWRILPCSSFENFRSDWDRINEAGSNSPVLNSAFVTCSLEAFGAVGKKLAIYEQDGETAAMGIFEKRKFGVWDTFQPSQAPLGLWVTSSAISSEELLKSLTKALPGIVLQLGLTQQDPDICPRPETKARISTLDYIDTAKVTTTGTFEGYWAARGKNLRHNMKRQRNRLNKEEISISLDIITTPEAVQDAIVAYGALESSGWKSSEGTAIHAENSQGKFYISLLEDFCSRDKGIICQYRYNSKLVATDLCIEQNGIFVILKTTYDENIRTSSPAFLMRKEMFEKLFADQEIRGIEFYGKVMEWHTKWSDQVRGLYHLNYRVM